MRLIDADEFISYLGLDCENSRRDNVGEIVTLEDFDRQETAYDVDKVVEQLENYIEDAKSEGNYSYIKPFQMAIEIVKSGGVNNE